ncbi:TetR/AcrR family transcriptional regulator [Actinophytocola glycyrrhizae]|uniref:TetR/AcrR family transcriptional regulator n=1 Tax=Actinophytocola glycyrrhizae TaxID=2044873 RepID=A0ABV9RSX3_9PSEU
MPTERKSPDAARRSRPARQAILTAALDLAAEVGYRRLSIEGIAARAGTGKQTIYRWWPSKGAVLFDALLALSENEVGEVGGQDGAAGLPDTGDLAADLKLVLAATVEELNNPRYSEPMRALTVEILENAELAATYRERLDQPVREMKKRRLLAAVAAGQLDPGTDLDLAIDLIWGPLQNRWLFREGPLTSAFTDALVDTALSGLAQASRRRTET